MHAHPRRVVLLVAAAAAVLMATVAPASAAPPPSAEAWTAERTAPYGQGSRFYEVVRCGGGADCSVTGGVDPQTGGATAGVAYSRSGPVPADSELVQGSALQSLVVPVPRGASKATATFTWTVHSAVLRASSEAGDVLAFAVLRADSTGCRKCQTSTGSADVAAVSSANGLSAARDVGPTTLTLKTTVTGALPRDLTLNSDATAVINSRPGDGLCPGGICLGSRRTASATVDATLDLVRVVFE